VPLPNNGNGTDTNLLESSNERSGCPQRSRLGRELIDASINGPGFQNWNISLHKNFPINERAGFEFSTDAYNFINHPNWAQIGQTGGLDLNPTSGTFGRVTQKSATNPRQLQVALRFYF
jgi:hypothetical protein